MCESLDVPSNKLPAWTSKQENNLILFSYIVLKFIKITNQMQRFILKICLSKACFKLMIPPLLWGWETGD